jgi:D-isomer specific 2-hydroxyacid dehydrogenase, NAD binding domain
LDIHNAVNPHPRGVILLDPFPRPIDLIFDAPTKASLESLGDIIWHDGPAALDEHIGEPISRAGIVDFDALLDAAVSGQIRAAIDVWPEESIPHDHRGRSTPNTLLQAHRAGNIPETWPLMGQMVVDDLKMISKGLPPQRCQRALWETVARMRRKPVS